MNKIFDCFSYWDENLLLDLRFHLLNDVVDYFVIVESTKTWQNNSKELKFDISKFQKFKNKILYIPVTDMPEGPNPWEREHFQRNCIVRGLKDSKDDDLVIISDADEIPNPKKITKFYKFTTKPSENKLFKRFGKIFRQIWGPQPRPSCPSAPARANPPLGRGHYPKIPCQGPFPSGFSKFSNFPKSLHPGLR